eukprot:scpid65630/ scgid10618/ YEATS domain-containing protein 2
MEKVCSLISEQFGIELEQKEREIQLIDQRLADVQSMLDRVRSATLLQYYGLTDAGPDTRSDPLKSSALKFTTGPSGGILLPSDESRKRSASPTGTARNGKPGGGEGVDVVGHDLRQPQAQGSTARNSADGTSPCSIVRKCIIVGNTSRFIREDQREVNDQSTHKWMVYVRGPKEEPGIDHFVSKVWFFLHPSYKPNDIVEVSQAPFHLTRRGWGEFPVRVRLFLSDNRHKPVDLVHSLRLDRSYSGLQALGAETMVNLELDAQLFHLSPSPDLAATPPVQVDFDQRGTAITVPPAQAAATPLPGVASSSHVSPVLLTCNARVEHSYALPSSSLSEAKLAVAEARAVHEPPCLQVTALKPADLAARIEDHLSSVNSSTGAVSLEQTLVDGVRFFPLVSTSQDKTVHPYVARSTAEFRSWSIGKQRASEWLRALALRRYLESRPVLPSVHKATTRYVFAWCRAQGHSRVILMGHTGPQSGVPKSPLPLCGLCGRLLSNGDHDVHLLCRNRCLQSGLTLSSCQPLLKELALQQAATLGHSGQQRIGHGIDVTGKFTSQFGKARAFGVANAIRGSEHRPQRRKKPRPQQQQQQQ